ncbi:hypothetical protein FZEAL_5776 [Fusarium zealandicum]|uniref:DUF7053 domain-containing protein n=1 Tax=Fusarium zealandicum TaxID=1053134 RepID=A0A8H4XK59_9HYPO|nr:hypothetical protein FZEAL_5776 [Fusarium zealandicum]
MAPPPLELPCSSATNPRTPPLKKHRIDGAGSAEASPVALARRSQPSRSGEAQHRVCRNPRVTGSSSFRLMRRADERESATQQQILLHQGARRSVACVDFDNHHVRLWMFYKDKIIINGLQHQGAQPSSDISSSSTPGTGQLQVSFNTNPPSHPYFKHPTMRTQRHLSLAVPVPGNVPPSAVLAAIHAFTPLIRHHHTLQGFDEVTVAPDAIADDPFFGPLDESVRAFQLRENVALAPGLSKDITYPAIFQAIPEGARSRAKAPAGIVVRTEFTVRQRRAGASVPISPAGSDSTGSTVTAVGDEYELHEEILIEGNSLLMPFITESLLAVHREICERLMVETVKDYFETGDIQMQ